MNLFPVAMFPLLLTCFILLRVISYFPFSNSLLEQQLLVQPLVVPNQCNDKCGELKIPFPFHLNSSCGSISNAFRLSCLNTTALYLILGSEKYRVLEFYSDGLLVDFPGSPSCRQYNDLNSFGFEGNDHFGVSEDNVIGLYDCEDSSLCKAECEAVDLPGCDGSGSSSSPACCYPLSDHSVWRLGDKFSVFSKFGCRGFSSWVVLRTTNSGKRGVKLEWAVPRNSSKSVCASNAYIANATAIRGGVRCLCQEGFVGDGFANGNGCIKCENFSQALFYFYFFLIKFCPLSFFAKIQISIFSYMFCGYEYAFLSFDNMFFCHKLGCKVLA